MDLAPYAAALESGEDFMLKRLMAEATAAGYTRYTSTKEDEWRMTLREPSRALVAYLREHDQPDPLLVDEDLSTSPAAAFGIREAQLHRARGVSFVMFLGVTKLVRDGFVARLRDTRLDDESRERALAITLRFFDKFELGFAAEWIRLPGGEAVSELQSANRLTTNEKTRYQTIFRSTPDPSFLVDEQLRIVDHSDSLPQFLRLPDGSLRGKSCREVIPCDSCEDCPVGSWPSEDTAFHDRELVVAVRGEPHHVLMSGAPLSDISRKNSGLVVFVKDITERRESQVALEKALVEAREGQLLKRAEARLRETDRRKDEFLAALSHELRNPLASIRSSLFVLDRAGGESREAAQAKAILNRQTAQLSRIVDDLLDVTRISCGKIVLQRELLELGALVRQAVEDHRARFVAAGLELDGQLPLGTVWVSADPTRLAQVLANLLENAAKFTRRGGRVELSLRREEESAVLRVSDDGVGIAPEVREQLFQPFMQAAQSLDRSSGGLGLGLALVKNFVQLHGGSVGVESAGPGRGAAFTVRLPVAGVPAMEAAPAATGPTGGRRVLVIEDNVDVAESLMLALELLGHEVRVALDGTTGLALAHESLPDLVLCDIGLPGLDGYGVARAFRSSDDLREVPLVALSGYARPDDLARAAAAGFSRHLAKPVSIDLLEQLFASGS